MEILKASGIYKDYRNQGNTTKVLKGINLAVNKNEFVSIVGKSGSGKSTLLYIMSALEPPTKGEVIFDGDNLNGLGDNEISKLRRRRFGFIFQFYNLIPDLTVADNIVLPLEIDGKRKRDYEDKLKKIMSDVGIYEKRGSYPYQLSGGQQQRTAIARALIEDPDIIFADEPTGNLDSKTSLEILELFKKLNKDHGKTIIMVTHDKIAASFGNRIIEINDGLIVTK